MIAAILSFVAGMLLFPVLYSLLPGFVAEMSKRRRFKIDHSKTLHISNQLAENIQKGLEECKDVAWANAFLQRFFVEMTNNYSFQTRIKDMVIKRFLPALKMGVIKEVKVLDLEFGKEAPYINSIRIANIDEFNNINKDIIEADDVNLEPMNKRLETDITEYSFDFINNPQPEISKDANILCDSSESVDIVVDEGKDFISFGDSTQYKAHTKQDDISEPTRLSDKLSLKVNKNDKKPQSIEFLDSKPMKEKPQLDNDSLQILYKNLLLKASVKYTGGLKISLNIELPKKMVVKSTVLINNINGDILVRMPAENYESRYEYAFTKDTEIEFVVESGLDAGKSKIYFQNSISKFIQKAIKSSFKNTIVYPNWFQLYLGFLPSSSLNEHRIEKISSSNIGNAANIAEKILSFISCDFKINSDKNDIFFRTSTLILNTDQKILLSHFKIPDIVNINSNDDIFVFEGLGVQDSRLLNRFVCLNALEGVISGFKGMQIVYVEKSYAITTLQFNSSKYEFIRILHKDCIIFQRNDPMRPDFFVFRIHDNNLRIYSFCMSNVYNMSPYRVEKLKNKLYSRPMELLGSNILYKMMHFRKQSGYKHQSIVETSAITNNTKHICGVSELEDIFHDILKVEDGKLKSKSLQFDTSKNDMIRFLHDDSVRLRLILEDGRICSSLQESDKIRTIVLEDLRFNEEFPQNRDIQELVVHSYMSDDFVIDLCIEKNLLVIFRVESIGFTKTCNLKLITRKEMDIRYPNYFIEALHLRISHDRFLYKASQEKYLVGGNSLKQEIKTFNGAIYFEFITEVEDDFQFKIKSCKKEAPLFEIYKIISNKPFRVLIPTENDYIRIILIPKHSRNKFIKYKLFNVDVQYDHFVDANIGLNYNCKFVLPIKGFPTHVIFWEKNCDSDIKSYLEDHESRNVVDNCGIIRAECRDYWLIFKNKEKKKRNIKLLCGLSLKK